jgi:SAM-dependent methyltransferase
MIEKVLSRFFVETEAGGFSRLDGTVQFYFRVNALLSADMTVLDLGAGRGLLAEYPVAAVRELYMLRGKVKEVVGVDIDPAVKSNPSLDRALIYDGKTIPLPDGSVDLIVSDHTFEHLDEPAIAAAEIARVLKPGGWVCARTPYILSLLAVASSLAPNRSHARLLAAIQPERKEIDVFPTRYRLNSFRALRRYFPGTQWEHFSYTWSPEPAYFFGSGFVFALNLVYDAIKRPLVGGEVLLVFLRKKSATA